MKYLKYIFLVCYIFLTLFIFIKAMENGEKSSTSSDQVTDIVIGAIDGITPGDESIADKFSLEDIKSFVRKAIGHFSLFLVMGIFSTLTYYLFIEKKLYSLIIILVVGILTAVISELLQGLPGDRHPSFDDVLIDYVGYLIAFIFTWCIIYLISKKNLKKVVSE